jgi:hypothetical protein
MDTNMKRTFPALTSTNYGSWADNMEAHLKTHVLWSYVSGTAPKPSPVDASKPTAAEQEALRVWQEKSDQASGLLWLAVEDDQKVHVRDVKGDPVEVWKALKEVHVQQKPGVRFQAYLELLGIRKEPDESLASLMGRSDAAMQKIKDLRPTGFTIENLDSELQSLALIRALPEEYGTFITSLLLLDSLAIAKLKLAFQAEETNRLTRLHDSASPTLALTSQTAPSSSTSLLECFFCGLAGHMEKDCFKKQKASQDAKEFIKNRSRGSGKGKKKQHGKEAVEEEEETGNSAQVEFAGYASALSTSDHSNGPSTRSKADWNTDTGASSHMTPNQHWFRSYSPHVVPIRIADNSVIYSAGIGSVEFQPVVEGELKCPIVFHDVLHVPKLGSNLLSLFHLTQHKGYFITIQGNQLCFNLDKNLLMTATVNSRNIGYLNGHVIVPQTAALASTCPLDLTLWHKRCSHLNFDDLKHMHRHNTVTGMLLRSKTPRDPICEPCIFGKQRRHNVPKAATRRTSTLALIHTDVKGPLPVQTPEGYKYWQPFLDDHSRWCAVGFLKRKSEAFPTFKHFKAYAEKKLGKQIQMSRDDKGGEFMGKVYDDFCAEEGILRQHTEPDEAHQNGVAEQANKDIANGATALLVQAKLPSSFWALAVSCYIHTRNRTPTSALGRETPYFYWKGKKPDISYFRVFGCLAYVLIRKEKRKALQPHSKKCIFVGYPEGVKAWKFWDPADRKFISSSHAVFDERYFPGNSTAAINLLVAPGQELPHPGGDFIGDAPPAIPGPPALLDAPVAPNIPPGAPNPAPNPPNPPAPKVPSRENPVRSARPNRSLNEVELSRQQFQRQPHAPPPLPLHSPSPDPLLMPLPQTSHPEPAPASDSSSDDELLLEDEDVNGELEYADAASSIVSGLEFVFNAQRDDYLTFDEAAEYVFSSSEFALKASAIGGEPKSFREAMNRPPKERIQWYKAATDEIQSLVENGTFELVQLPPGRKAIGSRWVFKVKRNADGSIERHKARLVAQGFAQRPGFDYTETFAPTPKWAALRAILALAALEDLELESVDISSAYLNGELEEEVYMKQPEGFMEKGSDWYWHLLKSLYGLKQAGRCWHKKLNEVLESLGFKRTICEHSIWVYHRGDVRIIIPVFIDDMTIAAKSKQDIQKVKNDLKAHFKLRDLGPTSFLLGVEVKRDRSKRTLTLSQRRYILDILERFEMSDCNEVATPLDPNIRLNSSMSPQTTQDVEAMHSIPYLQAVGALMYLAVATRPDIAYSVGVLARFNKNPGQQHWKAVKHLLRYLKKTMDYKLAFSPSSSTELFTTYTDADHGGNSDNIRSTSGHIVKMGTGAISWSSRLQGIVALSTTEAEYVAATSAGQEILWLRNLFTELGYKFTSPSTLHIDNQSALSVAKNPEHHGRMKHLDLRFYWLRNEVEKGSIHMVHLGTNEMPADIMTKSLGRVKVGEMVGMVGLVK